MGVGPLPPDPTNPDLLKGIRQFLMDSTVVRDPRSAGDLPPMWLAQRFGVPAPGEAEGLNPVEVGPTIVTGIKFATGIAPARFENFLRQENVVFQVRAKEEYLAKEFEQEVRALLNDKRGWLMANVPVNESLLFRDLTFLRSDNSGFDYNFEYTFSLWAPES